MNAIPAVSALGWALVDFLWQGALVGCAAAIALMLLRNARPQARYALCCAALALCLALPVFGFWHGLHADAAVGDAPASRFVQLVDSPQPPVAATTTTAIAPASSFAHSLPWIVALWSLGAALLAARMALGMMWVAHAGRAHGMPHPRWQRRLDRLADKLGVACSVRLRLVAELATPVAAGCWKPVVLVPAALISEMPLDLVEALLAHELAHIRRHDYLVNLVQSAIEALLFYHPVVWWLSRRIRVEREQIADDLAVAAIGEPQRLALALHELDLFQQRLREADDDGIALDSLLPAATGGHLMSRIQRLVRPNPHALSWNIALPIIGLSAICMAVYAHDSHGAAKTAAIAAAPVIAAPALPATAAPAIAAIAPAAPAIAATMVVPAVNVRVTAPVIAAASVTVHGAAHHGDAYAIVREGKESIQMSGDSRDMPAIEQLRKKVHGDFIWVRRGGKTWIVQDQATIAGVLEALKPVEALDAQMEVLDKKMEGPNSRMEELDKQMEALERDNSHDDAMEKSSKQMDALSRQQDVLSRKMDELAHRMERAPDDAQRQALDRQMETLQAQMEPLNRQMDELGKQMDAQGRQYETAQKPMEDLGRQMEEAGKPMEEIGKQMEVLGKQEEQLSREVDQRVQATLDEAMRSGKATSGDALHLE
ncbi:MAG TPA: M56 family metallopeptidase [Xanthomonadaceae bacterium]|jgi:beta-lactamase regulating signal transducer with metallopeptidase domain/predicted  nucleic acid-binding Zn-ribbon protein